MYFLFRCTLAGVYKTFTAPQNKCEFELAQKDTLFCTSAPLLPWHQLPFDRVLLLSLLLLLLLMFARVMLKVSEIFC